MNHIKKSFKPRMVLRHLHQSKKLSDQAFHQEMTDNFSRYQPFYFANLQLQILGTLLFVAGIICITAFNWFGLSDFSKLTIVESALLISFISILVWKNSAKNALASAIFTVLIGVFWAVFGQLYQINSSLYHYSFVWGISVLPFAIILRQQFTTALTLLLFYSAFFIYLSAHTQLSNLNYSIVITSITAVLTIGLILLKKYKVRSISTSTCYIFFILLLGSIFSLAVSSIFSRFYFFPHWMLLIAATVILTIIFLYLNEKGMMVIMYLYTILIFFIGILSSFNYTIFSSTLTISLTALCAIYPTYRGAILLIEYSKKVHNHEKS